MRRYSVVLDNTDSFDTVIEWLLAGLLAFMPLAFGAARAWSEEVVVALSGAIVICFLLKLIFRQDQGIIWSWAYVPAGLFLLVAILQLIPLPTGLIRVVSPNTAALKTELLGDLPDAGVVLKSMTFSFYPNATKHDLRLVLTIVGVFVVVLNVFRRPEQIKRLLMTIALIGGVIVLITLAQNLFGNDKLYWFVSTKYGQLNSGPFVNHSHYGQFINLSIGAAFAFLMVRLREEFAGKKLTPPAVFDYLGSTSAKTVWILITIISLGAATVFVSLSRGGMVSMLIAAAFTTLLITSRRSLKSSGWIMVVTALVAFTCILYIGFDAVCDRLATLRDLDKSGGRWQILKDVLVCFGRFPVLGTGLGTHSVVYPMFERLTITALVTHAENEYAQAAGETGLIGLGVLIIFGIIVWSNYVRSIRNADIPICSAAYGFGFGILAILLHSLSDFGQHLPANAFLSAVFCALLLTLAGRKKTQKSASERVARSWRFKCLRIAVLLGASGIWVWLFIGANNARIAEAHWDKVLNIEKDLAEKNWQGNKAEYAELISHAAEALDHQPENIKYRHWLNVYRLYSVCPVTNFYNVSILEDSIPSLLSIVEEFQKVRIHCPTFGATYCVLGQIEKFILNDPAGAEKIRKGFRLAPCDPVACFVAGNLDVSEGRVEDCIEKFNKAVQLDSSLFRTVVDIYVNQLSRPRLAVAIAGDDVDRLSHVADVLEDMQYSDLAEQIRDKVKELFEAKCSQPDASPFAFASLADIYRQKKVNESAIEYYRRALALDYGQVCWRLSLARLLAETEQVPEAINEARICLRLQPQSKEAERLLGDLSVLPAALGEDNK